MDLTFLTKRTRLLNLSAAVALAITLFLIFYFAPTERMGHVQRLFYFHVGAAWVSAVTFFVALLCGLLYLWKPHPSWDKIALASVEIGVMFMTMTIVSGSVWGKPAWNTWWVWSPRLTSITIMWLVYVAYFLLRGALDDPEKKRRFSAVYLVAAFATVVITYGSIRILRDIHPVMFGGALESAQGAEQGLQEFSGLDSRDMGITLGFSTFTFTLLYLAWLANRIRLQNMLDEATQLKTRVIAYLQEG